MSLRFPSGKQYALQVEKEQYWLPRLQPQLPITISKPIAQGVPGEGYAYPWSVYQWLQGDTPTYETIANINEFARDLGMFLRALQLVDASGGPLPGDHNFYRGGALQVYHRETMDAIACVHGALGMDAGLLTAIWMEALHTQYKNPPVWIHGDVVPSNLLIQNGRLYAAIDFGMLGVGDPACDTAIAWTFFTDAARYAFLQAAQLDWDTQRRGRAWALWKALITFRDRHPERAQQEAEQRRIICEIIQSYKTDG